MTINIDDNYLDKKYNLPKDIVFKTYKNFGILISISNANWIIFENQEQIEIYKSLSDGSSVGECLEKFFNNRDDLINIVTQIEGKHFNEKIDIDNEDAFALRIYMTNECNLRCTHCFMYAGKKQELELSVDEIKFILIESCKYGCNKLILTGGEVCLNQNLSEIIKLAKSLGVYVLVMTNGTLWTDKSILELSDYIDEVQVSIDGFDETSNSEIRGIGVFDVALKCIDKFISTKKVATSIVLTPMYDNINKYRDEYTKFAVELLEKYKEDDFLFIIGDEIINGRNIKANKEKNKNLSVIVSEILEELYENNELTAFVNNHKYNRIIKGCGYGTLTVSAIGDVYFCSRIYEVKKYANIREENLNNILNLRSKARKLSQVDNVTPCKDCELKYICGGGCRIANIPDVTTADLGLDSQMFKTECDEKFKDNILRLMIESNDFLLY